MSPFEEGPGKTRSAHGPNKPANKIGIVEILLAVLIVYLLFQVIRFNQHTAIAMKSIGGSIQRRK